MNQMAPEAVIPEPTPWERDSDSRLYGSHGSVARMTPIGQRDLDVLETVKPNWKRNAQQFPSQSSHGLT